MRTCRGTVIGLCVICTALSVAAVRDPPPTREQSLAAFDRLKSLEGRWIGRSTKGWEEKSSFTTIAGGSCVVGSSFDAHPDEQMMTMFHMDGDSLMLTHYCVAKNQPRMRATEISDDGKTVLFTYMDATNLKSRDTGHMDKARFRFESPDRFTSQWTWYQYGKEQWMEEIVYVRAAGPATQPGSDR